MRFALATNLTTLRLLWCSVATAFIFQNLPKVQASDWKLVQMCRDTGETFICLSDKAVKIETKRTQIIVISKAPDWNVYIFSNLTKAIIKLDLAHYDGQFHMVYAAFGNPNFTTAPLCKFEDTKLWNIPIEKHHTLPNYAAQQINLYHARAFSGIFPRYVEYWTAPSLSHSKQICTVLSRNYGCPDLHAVPIQLTWLPVVQDPKETQLRTIKCDPASFTDKDFEVPKGYKAVKEYQQVNPHTAGGNNDTLLYDALKGFKDT
jgi:hypothetical protein